MLRVEQTIQPAGAGVSGGWHRSDQSERTRLSVNIDVHIADQDDILQWTPIDQDQTLYTPYVIDEWAYRPYL